MVIDSHSVFHEVRYNDDSESKLLALRTKNHSHYARSNWGFATHLDGKIDRTKVVGCKLW